MEKEIQSILEKEEKVLWKGKQDLKSTMIMALFGSVTLLIIAGFLFFATGDSEAMKCTINGVEKIGEDCANVISVAPLVLLGFAILSLIMGYLSYKVTRYVITDKRLLIKSGLIGADMRSIYYDQIKSVFVNVGVIGKIFGTGSILIDTGMVTRTQKGGTKVVYVKFSNINDPYGVYKFTQEGLSSRKEGLHSGRADFESNKEGHKDFIQETERIRRRV